MLHSHIGGAPVDITELHSAILRKNIVVAKADAEMICERLMFDPVSRPTPQFAGLRHGIQRPEAHHALV
jgi:hypothetical protein